MKIAILISSLRFGGAEKQAVIDAELLSKDHEVTFIAFEEGQLKDQLPDSVEFIRLKKTNYFSTALRLAKILRSRQIGVIHAHLFAPMLISSMATLLCRTVAVWNFHSHAYQDADKGRFAHSLLSKMPGVKRILFPAKELKEYYRSENFTFPEKKEMIFYNSGQFWDRQPLPNPNGGKVTIGFVGRIIPLKRVHLLLDLGRELKSAGNDDFKISIVGDGPTLPELKSRAAEMGIENLVDFHGFQSDTLKYYRGFSIFTLPSEEEVLSLSLIDAQLMGLPCVAFDVGGNPDVVENGRSGFIVDQERAFQDRIRDLILDRELRRSMGERAIEQSTGKFSQKARLENLEKLYEKVLSE